MASLTDEEIELWKNMFENSTTLELSEEDYLKFIEILENPPKPNKKLKEAVRRYMGTFGVKNKNP